jgi:DNA-3-methyladenine glycosylase
MSLSNASFALFDKQSLCILRSVGKFDCCEAPAGLVAWSPGWRRRSKLILMPKLSRDFYDRDTITVAKELLGKELVHVVNGKKLVGRIVETEAYLGPHDLAAHSARGKTVRTQVMFGPPGFAYVYFVYGMHFCMNVVTDQEGHASAVLLRAIEPISGIEGSTNGPARLCKAMSIDRALNGHDLLSNTLFIRDSGTVAKMTIVKRPRIGVDYAGKKWSGRLLRFYVRGNQFISRK